MNHPLKPQGAAEDAGIHGTVVTLVTLVLFHPCGMPEEVLQALDDPYQQSLASDKHTTTTGKGAG